MVLFPSFSSDYSLSYSFDKYLLSIGHLPGTVLSTGTDW